MLKKLLSASAALIACAAAYAFIDPRFTPVNLVEQSDSVWQVRLDKEVKNGKATGTVVRALKGAKPEGAVTFDLGAAIQKEAKMIEEVIASGATDALFFVGQFENGAGGPPGAQGAKGLLNLNGKWIVFFEGAAGAWDMEKIDSRVQGTWAGGTDMLLRAVEYIQSDPDADVPVSANVEWDTPVMFASVPGKVRSAGAVLMDDSGTISLLVTREGDFKLFAWKDGKMCDVTGDGQTVIVWGLRHARRFQQPPEELRAGLGASGRMFEADFDGDGLPDLLWLYEKGALFCKGTEAGTGSMPGKFADPVRTQLALGKGRSTAQLGDYDADGLLDVFCSAEDGNRLWHNLGKGQFVQTLALSGEIAYSSRAGGVDGMTGDVNNDGRQDILIAYAELTPQVFFNRGFRSFGHAREIDLGEQKLVPESAKGQQACALADFTGDGAQDMVIVLNNGDAWLFPRKVGGGKALNVSVSLGKDAPSPLVVVGYAGKRCLGAWNVERGGNPAFFGLLDAGTIALKWRLPTGEEKSAKVDVIDRPVRYVVGQ